MRDRQNPKLAEGTTVSTRPGAGVTTLGFLIGDRTLVVGDSAGGVSTWQIIPPPGGGERRLTRVYQFEGHPGPVVALGFSERDKGFATGDASGLVRVHYGTSGQTLLSMKAEGGDLRSVVFAPKADGVLAVNGKGTIAQWQLDNPHPEVTFKTIFGKVWYEGYSQPEYVWQSTGGTDDFEAKFSLTPLIFGTIKGTVYALLIAVPLALLGALYVSEFMHPTVKGYVKPVIEVMAALPSVVLGFLAGLWLAPMIERIVPVSSCCRWCFPCSSSRPASSGRRCRPESVAASSRARRCSCSSPWWSLGAWLAFAWVGSSRPFSWAATTAAGCSKPSVSRMTSATRSWSGWPWASR